MSKPILCLDFDGVCHAYTSPWQRASIISDDAVPGLFPFLEQAHQVFDVQVFSSRSKDPSGILAMQTWFQQQWQKCRAPDDTRALAEVVTLAFPDRKPAAFLTIDDRAITFDGTWPEVGALRAFKPWNQRV